MTNAERAKKYLKLFLAQSYRLPLPAVDDLVDECQRVCNEIRFYKNYSLGYTSVEQVILDYLSLGDEHAWIFKDTTPCTDCPLDTCNDCPIKE